ncbi:riboflavin synthase [Desulfovibrio sulfodismutans]|uniref:Riboflavin synthase n=1 Tax=Desulfolutivibrio sulfodismutans TaxID=63561 RepID=A0A7K3NJC8_9BACT|nr:riboflavin synthase [Desulfolutivibrio sulfodismutans]NDY56280.1 riboflavin synthase [Desulfolutivibrio sulfodismutans]QLA13591.1 riboflavin synthase [Desulfolutivibrio sulfodismutans DSM 3696]
MFTGLVMGCGRVAAMSRMGRETRLSITALFSLPDIVLGESIAVNGACLTVETAGKNEFSAYASAETLARSSLGLLKTGSTVNLERALCLGDRLGGHLVSGHVDCLAEVESIVAAGQSRIYRLKFPAEHGEMVVAKGSVALDGISLTVNECGPDFLTVNIIPETQKATTISGWKPGTAVNMETDLIGKYVRRMLGPFLPGAGTKAAPTGAAAGGLTEAFLRGNGF